MARKRRTAEESIGKLREVEVGLAPWRQTRRAVPRDRCERADPLAMARRIGRAEAGPGDAAEGSATRECAA